MSPLYVGREGQYVRLGGGVPQDGGSTPPGDEFHTLFGIYNGGPSENPDQGAHSLFGMYPEIASTYVQGTQPQMNIAYESARINRGTAGCYSLTAKNGPVTHMDIANQTPEAEAHLTTHINALKTLSEINPNVPVYATLEQEFEVKRNQGSFFLEPMYYAPDPTFATYAAALSHFCARVHAEAPLVQTTYWFGEGRQNDIRTIVGALTTLPKVYCADPYRWSWDGQSAGRSATIEPVVHWFRNDPTIRAKIGDNIRFGLSEWGTPAAFPDANNAAFITGVRDWAEALELEFIIYFNRDGIEDHRINSQPLSVAAFAAEMAGA